MKNNFYIENGVGVIVLNNGGLALVDPEDLDLLDEFPGTFFAQKRRNTSYAAVNVGTCRADTTCRLLHGILLGSDRTSRVDHINGNGLDNQRLNLRLSTPSENGQNVATARSHSTTGVRGVGPAHGKYRARVTILGKEHHLGLFETIEAAEAAVKKARAELMPFSEEARCN